MTRLVLDTTILIDAERTGDALDQLIGDDDDIAIAAITLAELRVGVLTATGRRRTRRSAYFDDIAATVPVLDYDTAAAQAHAELLVAVRHQGRPRGAHDLIIAATAKATARTVVTADEAGFFDLPGVDLRHHR